MEFLIVVGVIALWVVLLTFTGSTYSAVRRIERRVDDFTKKQEQREMYERMRNQQYQQSQQYQQYGNMNGYDQNNRL